MTQPNESLLTSAEVAALLQVHPKHIYRLLRRGLPGHRVGGEWRFSRAEVLRWAEGNQSRTEEAQAPTQPAQTAALLAANGDVAVELLLSSLEEKGELVGFVLSDRGRALRYLQQGAVLFAGCHGNDIPARLGEERLARIHLVEREVGLASPKSAPLRSLSALKEKRLASRPPSAGVYAHLVEALQKERLSAEEIQKKALVLDSHQNVACAISRGEAEVGLLTKAWAARLGFSFYPLAVESYGLLVKAKSLGDARIVRLCEVAQSKAYQQKLKEVSGYQAQNAGDIRYDTEGGE